MSAITIYHVIAVIAVIAVVVVGYKMMSSPEVPPTEHFQTTLNCNNCRDLDYIEYKKRELKDMLEHYTRVLSQNPEHFKQNPEQAQHYQNQITQLQNDLFSINLTTQEECNKSCYCIDCKAGYTIYSYRDGKPNSLRSASTNKMCGSLAERTKIDQQCFNDQINYPIQI
jgi:hypothetical protein